MPVWLRVPRGSGPRASAASPATIMGSVFSQATHKQDN